MHQRQAILVVIAFLQVLVVSRILMNVNTELQKLELRRNARCTSAKRDREDDELALIGAFICPQKRVRRFWIDARSNHWIVRVLDGMLLQEGQFDKAFRMSRNSFDVLHSVLGIFQRKSTKNNV